MEYINGESLIAVFFVCRSYQNKYDVEVHGINGHFYAPAELMDFITNPNEQDLSYVKKEIEEKYPETEHDQFYWVHVKLSFESGEYSDYGQCICEPFYIIDEVLDVVVEDVETEVTEYGDALGM